MHIITGYSLRGAVVIRMAVMNVVETLICRSDPQSLVAIQK